jgi:hypothetical protein
MFTASWVRWWHRLGSEPAYLPRLYRQVVQAVCCSVPRHEPRHNACERFAVLTAVQLVSLWRRSANTHQGEPFLKQATGRETPSCRGGPTNLRWVEKSHLFCVSHMNGFDRKCHYRCVCTKYSNMSILMLYGHTDEHYGPQGREGHYRTTSSLRHSQHPNTSVPF